MANNYLQLVITYFYLRRLYMNHKMDRKQFKVATHEELEQDDKIYWNNASVQDKFETITYLRECFYGPEATTGRLQRFYQILELK